MKKLVILLIIVAAIGAAAAFMLNDHSDLQVQLPTSYTAEPETTDDPVTEETDGAQPRDVISFSPSKAFHDSDFDFIFQAID